MNSGYKSCLYICFKIFLYKNFLNTTYNFQTGNRNYNLSDFSHKLDNPVDILMSVQLGGGTDITKAVRYGQSLIKKPKKCIMVIISDFYEGRPESDLTKAIRNVLEGGTKILGIASLGYQGEPFYNRAYAKKLQNLGVDVIASTPELLPEIIAKIINKK